MTPVSPFLLRAWGLHTPAVEGGREGVCVREGTRVCHPLRQLRRIRPGPPAATAVPWSRGRAGVRNPWAWGRAGPLLPLRLDFVATADGPRAEASDCSGAFPAFEELGTIKPRKSE